MSYDQKMYFDKKICKWNNLGKKITKARIKFRFSRCRVGHCCVLYTPVRGGFARKGQLKSKIIIISSKF